MLRTIVYLFIFSFGLAKELEIGTMMPKANQAKKQKPRKRVLKPKPQVEPDWDKMSDEEIEKFFER